MITMYHLQGCVNLLIAKKVLFTQIGLGDVLGLQNKLICYKEAMH